jgi:hypothetical protein
MMFRTGWMSLLGNGVNRPEHSLSPNPSLRTGQLSVANRGSALLSGMHTLNRHCTHNTIIY